MVGSALLLSLQQTRKSFFNAAKVQELMARRKRIAFIRIGAFVRHVAKKSMPYRVGPSVSPNPPHSHTGLLRNFIFYAYDSVSDTMVAGPLKVADGALKTKPLSDDGSGQSPTGASVLEFGGRVVRSLPGGQVSKFKIRQRSYMLPAMQRSVTYARLREAWSELG